MIAWDIYADEEDMAARAFDPIARNSLRIGVVSNTSRQRNQSYHLNSDTHLQSPSELYLTTYFSLCPNGRASMTAIYFYIPARYTLSRFRTLLILGDNE